MKIYGSGTEMYEAYGVYGGGTGMYEAYGGIYSGMIVSDVKQMINFYRSSNRCLI
ncbi:hypothetical protein SAMN04488121_107110 [Chitinophaga filiformis]|uniref:Uncharacterized protein n=1 Tax=Chitinophaga filiformis TaxID=104663 RepID=A0A1G7XWH0_CHIFI|nr:hypothetical protein SAMN04488121_107110 [Chitinophaga filiformis]